MESVLQKSKTKVKLAPISCAHCGDPCNDDAYRDMELHFCCGGCKAVYTLLRDNDLSLFYNIDSNAGLSQRGIRHERYDYLDDVDIQKVICNYIDDKMCKVWLNLPTIHCTSCLWLLENIGRLNSGIESATVNYLEKKALFQIRTDLISLRELVELLTKIGYPPHIALSDSDGRTDKVDRSLFYKLGIAGFVFGNIMLLSFPEYLGLQDGDFGFSDYIRYINIVLILPVIFYCATDYYKSAYNGLLQKHLNIDVPVSLGITALFAKSIYDIVSMSGPGYLDSLAGLIFFLLIGKWFQKMTYSRIQFDLDYKSYFPIAATILNDEDEQKVSLQKLVPDNIIRVRHGELIPADGRLLSQSADIDYSFVTGEKEPLSVSSGDGVYSGGIIDGAMADICIEKTVNTSYLTQLWNDVSFVEKKKEGNISRINEVLSKYFTISILAIAIIAFSYHAVHDINLAVNVFAAVLIIACPCAVALSIPFTFGNLIRLLAKKNIYFKNTKVVEKCSKLNYLVFDKTGTITNSKSKEIFYFGDVLSVREKQVIVSLSTQSSHSMSNMITDFINVTTVSTVADFNEKVGKGITGIVNEKEIKIGSKTFFELEQLIAFEEKYPFAADSNVYFSIDDEIKGAFKKSSSFVSDLSFTLEKLSKQFTISLISGDNANDADALRKISDKWQQLDFQKSPFEKLNYIKRLQEKKYNVAMIGDGLNDAGALSQSDVGIAVTDDTSNFTPASDIIFNASNFHAFPELFSICKSAVYVIYVSYFIAISYNLIGLSYAVQGLLSPVIAAILMPLSSITVVFFGFISSTILIRRSGL